MGEGGGGVFFGFKFGGKGVRPPPTPRVGGGQGLIGSLFSSAVWGYGEWIWIKGR